jgi:hypothetical protein
MRMMEHEPARGPSPEQPEQPTLPFERGAPKGGSDEPTGPEVDPRGVWEALPAATKAGVRRDCLRAMRKVIDDAPE